MAKYYVDLVDSHGNILYTEDEVFDNYEDADEYALDCACAFAEGGEGREEYDDYQNPDEHEYVVRQE